MTVYRSRPMLRIAASLFVFFMVICRVILCGTLHFQDVPRLMISCDEFVPPDGIFNRNK